MENPLSPRYLTVVEESSYERDASNVGQGWYKSNFAQSKSQIVDYEVDEKSSHDSVEPLKIFDVTILDGVNNNRYSQRLSYVEKTNFFEPAEGHTKSYPYLKQPAVYRNRIARLRRYFKSMIAANPDEIMRASDI